MARGGVDLVVTPIGQEASTVANVLPHITYEPWLAQTSIRCVKHIQYRNGDLAVNHDQYPRWDSPQFFEKGKPP